MYVLDGLPVLASKLVQPCWAASG